ncbi:7726_t:CDS:2, partial [Racocetra persica]
MEKINIAISGPCALGKSSVGYLLATKLNYQFIETDLFYQYLASKTSSFDEEELINILNNEEPKYLFQKGFVVVGCDSTTNILPDVEIKFYLTANFETRVDHQQKQFNLNNDMWLDIITRDSSLIKKTKKISDNIDTTYLEISEVVDLILKNTDDFEYFVQKIAGVYGVSANKVKVYQGNNNRTDIIVKHIDSKQEKYFICFNYDNKHECVDAATHGNGIIAYIIQVTERNGGLDLLLSYQGNQICVQYKDRENALTLSILKEFEFTMTHFKNSLGILVYNSKTMKTKKYLTKQAKLWLDNSSQQIIVCDEEQVVNRIKNFFENNEESELILTDFQAEKFFLNGIDSDNVHIKKIILKRSVQYSPYKKIIHCIYHFYNFLKPKEKNIIVFTGAIGSGKSTVARLFKRYLQKRRYVIYLPKEMSLQLKDELEIFYQDT